MTTEHRYVKPADPAEYKCLVAGPIDTGDIVKWDTTGLKAERQATGGATTCIGVSMDTIPLPSRIDSSDVVDRIRVVSEGVFSFKTTATESYKHGLWVEVGADSQTIKLTSTDANKIGKVWLPDGSTVTGAAGVEVQVKIMPQYVGNNL